MDIFRYFAVCGLLFLASPVISIPVISAVGSKFYNSEGQQFFIKGVAYGDLDDPLTATDQCTLDATLMKNLGVNTIRVYTVDANLAHDGCMKAFSDVGIYVLLDLSGPTYALNRVDPSWGIEDYNQYTAVMDAFAKFDNVLGFFSGNSVITIEYVNAAPYVLAVTVDLKKYRDSKGYREIPIGYGGEYSPNIQSQLQSYLVCSNDTTLSADFFGVNNFAWCGDSSTTKSGFDVMLKQVDGYSIPMFLAETGCNTIQPREFGEIGAILGEDMAQQFSGAIVYQWAEAVNGYGLVSYAVDNTVSGTPTPIPLEFSNLKSQWQSRTPEGTPSSLYTPAETTPACPSSASSNWPIDPRNPIPTLGLKLVSTPRTTASIAQTSSSGITGLPTLSRGGSSSRANISPAGTSGSANQSEGSAGGSSSTGKTVGIAVGAVVVLAILAIAVFFLLRRRRPKKIMDQSKLSDHDPSGLEVRGVETFPPKPELAAYSDTANPERTTYSATTENFPTPVVTTANELPVGSTPSELHTNEVSSSPKLLSTNKSPLQTSTFPAQFLPHPSNIPWTQDAGREEFGVKAVQLRAATTLAEAQSDDQIEIRRLEEEEWRIDAEIAEHERLRKLQEAKAAVRAKLAAARAIGSGNSAGTNP